MPQNAHPDVFGWAFFLAIKYFDLTSDRVLLHAVATSTIARAIAQGEALNSEKI